MVQARKEGSLFTTLRPQNLLSYCIVTSREFLEVVVVTGIMLDALTMALSHYLQNYACHTKPPQEVLDLYRKNRMQ